jgi:hypothetical protein
LFRHGGLLGGGEAEDLDTAGLGTDEVADPTSGTAGAGVFGGMVAVVVQAVGKVKDFGGTGLDTESAAFAFFRVHRDRSAIRLRHGVHLREIDPLEVGAYLSVLSIYKDKEVFKVYCVSGWAFWEDILIQCLKV